jgi:hypothetical protein
VIGRKKKVEGTAATTVLLGSIKCLLFSPLSSSVFAFRATFSALFDHERKRR